MGGQVGRRRPPPVYAAYMGDLHGLAGLSTDPDPNALPPAPSAIQLVAQRIIIDSVSAGIKKGVDDVWREYGGAITGFLAFFAVCAGVTAIATVISAAK